MASRDFQSAGAIWPYFIINNLYFDRHTHFLSLAGLIRHAHEGGQSVTISEYG